MSAEEAQAEFGVLGIATIKRPPILSAERPATPGSAAREAAEAGLTPLGWWRSATDPLSMILIAPTGMAITPVTTSMGAIYGGLAGKSSEHTDRAMSTLEAAIRTVNVHQRLRDLLVARVSREYSVVPVNDTATADGELGTVVEAAIHFVYLEGDGKGVESLTSDVLRPPAAPSDGHWKTGLLKMRGRSGKKLFANWKAWRKMSSANSSYPPPGINAGRECRRRASPSRAQEPRSGNAYTRIACARQRLPRPIPIL